LKEKLVKLESEMQRLAAMEKLMLASAKDEARRIAANIAWQPMPIWQRERPPSWRP
jgi:hypothetical protein